MDARPKNHSCAGNENGRRLNVKPYFKMAPAGPAPREAGGGGPWNVPDLCAAYNWPNGLAGGGVIAIVELGGGWVPSDMDRFFRNIGQPLPNITDVSVDGARNTPDPAPNGADGEVALDIEVAARGLLCRDRQAGDGPRLLGAGHCRRGPGCDRRRLRRVLDFVGRRRSGLGCGGRQGHGGSGRRCHRGRDGGARGRRRQ